MWDLTVLIPDHCLSIYLAYKFSKIIDKNDFPFGFECGMWDSILLIPDHFLSVYFT